MKQKEVHDKNRTNASAFKFYKYIDKNEWK